MDLAAHRSELMPAKAGQQRYWNNLFGSAAYLAVAELARQHDGLVVLVTEDSNCADGWQSALHFFSGADNPGTFHFPDWETLPYDAFSPHQDIISERLATLQKLPHLERGILVVPVTTLLQKICPRAYVSGNAIELAVGQTLDVAGKRLELDAAGYQASDMVSERGQYAVRGAVMDIFAMGAEHPVRIDLFDDEIDTLRTFDPDTQRTIGRIESLRLLPAKEFPFDEDAVAAFRTNWHNTFNVDVRRCSIYQDVSSYISPNGVEYYLPFFFERLGTLFDYLPANVLVVFEPGVEAAADKHLANVAARYESLRHDIEHPILPPGDLFLRFDELMSAVNAFPRVALNSPDHKHAYAFPGEPLPDLLTDKRRSQGDSALLRYLATQQQPVLFVAESAGRREVFDDVLRRMGVQTQIIPDFKALPGAQGPALTVGRLFAGMRIPGCTLITEADVLGTRQHDFQRDPKQQIIDPDLVVRSLTELNIGAPVVHVDHGVGRYLGLTTLEIDGAANEFLALQYAGNDKLYVPVTSLQLIARYAGSDEEHAPLHRLGSDQWERAKRKAAEKVVDVAAELLDIYARRELKQSFKFTVDAAEYRKFAAEFPFEVTMDQQQAIDDTLADMTTERAMDRLICGDVGFGKTEVAMRAAFVAVQNNKQVAILVPTTLLAQQHFDTFCDRFANWPVAVESVSRLRSDQEVSEALSHARAGNVDILIGTHKLLGDQVAFKDLGLLIIDEEHRFGVRQKERLKKLRAEVDVLTLTATPIPRTLNMAVSGIRDLSIIATPPARRLSIKTFVAEKRRQLVREAISRELLRGGQVFYLYNEVRSIQRAADELAQLIPEARIGVGHGQMPKRDLERVMSDFYHRQLNVLVCTTIIETGLDIPNANTIIIERADKFGLAQLHQLRGRVGRSHRQAYAYLLTPEAAAMTGDARKRLDAIEAAGDLGIGFTLATHDMEIRGAGELLGDDQSGQIESVGFTLYMDMLQRAIDAIRSGRVPDAHAPLEPVSQEVNLHAATLIPADYMPDVHTRLILYKRISNARNSNELEALQIEFIDRFGLLPEALRRLFAVTELKLAGQALGIVKIDLGPERGKLEFSNHTTVDPIKIVNLVQREADTYRLEGATTLRITADLAEFAQRTAFVANLLERLTPEAEAA